MFTQISLMGRVTADLELQTSQNNVSALYFGGVTMLYLSFIMVARKCGHLALSQLRE